MKISISRETKDLLTNLAFSLIIAVCCVVAYDRFFVPKFPKIYVVDVNKMESDFRDELVIFAFNNNNGIPVDAEFVEREFEKLVAFIEKVAKENNAFVYRKDNMISDGTNVVDITEEVLNLYKKQAGSREWER